MIGALLVVLVVLCLVPAFLGHSSQTSPKLTKRASDDEDATSAEVIAISDEADRRKDGTAPIAFEPKTAYGKAYKDYFNKGSQSLRTYDEQTRGLMGFNEMVEAKTLGTPRAIDVAARDEAKFASAEIRLAQTGLDDIRTLKSAYVAQFVGPNDYEQDDVKDWTKGELASSSRLAATQRFFESLSGLIQFSRLNNLSWDEARHKLKYPSSEVKSEFLDRFDKLNLAGDEMNRAKAAVRAWWKSPLPGR